MEDIARSAQPASRPIDRRLLDLLTLLEPLDQYLREVKRIAASEERDAREKMQMIREIGSALLAAMDRHFTTVTKQAEERRRELQEIMNPPSLDLFQQIQQHLREISALIDKIALRERLIQQWDQATADDICRTYEERLLAGDRIMVELFETYAEAILQRKGNAAALAAFRERRERARGSRLTPAQVRAKHELEDLQKFESSLSLMRAGFISMLRLYEAGA